MMSGIEAVIVNHDTSLFSELALRSLWALGTAAPLRVTVSDNHSSDADLASLQAACRELGAAFEPTRWPVAEKRVNTHGDVLRDFVSAGPDADYYLFVDCDIDFDEPDVVGTMLDDLGSDPALWAVQARFRSTERSHGEGASLDIWAGRPISVHVGADWGSGMDERPLGVVGHIYPRVHPGCTLVANTPAFRRAVETVGLACAVIISQDEGAGGFLDTMGLASAAMTVAGYRYALSRATVHHFFNASYDDKHVAAREADCRERLARFR